MKITIYTISDCFFSKQEKEYLQSHNLPFEERNLEENREFLTEMLTISNNFAGTPVTKIEKDDGQIVVLKGFTKSEFDTTFQFAPLPDMQDAMSQIKGTDTIEPQKSQDAVGAPSAPAYVPKSDIGTPVTTPSGVDLGSIAAQIEQLKKLQESLAAQAQQPSPVVSPPVPPMPSYVAPPVQPVAPPVAPSTVSPPPVPAPVVPATAPTNVDDSLAAILAELQTKINSSQSNGTPGTPPTTN